MDIEQIAEALALNELFSELDTPTRLALARHVEVRRCGKGETVVVQDEPGDTLYAVVKGMVRVVRRSRAGDVVELTRKGPGQVFGEVALIDGGLRSASVVATNRAVLLCLRRALFIELLQREPSTIEPLLRVLGKMVREIATLSTDLAVLDPKARLARRILTLAADSEGSFHDLVDGRKVSQSQLAQMIGTTRQTVNLLLKRLENEGCLRVKPNGIELLSIEQMEVAGR